MPEDPSPQQPNDNSRVKWLLVPAGWVLTSLLVVAAYLLVVRPDLRLWAGVETYGSTDRREIALTFDDGPHPLWAPLLADTLERHGAKGTFFLVGFEAQRYPEITARLVRGGHQLGNHSLTHPYPNLTALSKAQIAYEIHTTNRILTQFTRQPMRYFRPPGGGLDDDVIETLQSERLTTAWWSENIGDWSDISSRTTADRLHRSLRPGLVVLMHQRANTVTALEHLLADQRQGDYTLVTLETLMRH